VLTVIGDDGNVAPTYYFCVWRAPVQCHVDQPDTFANATAADPNTGSARENRVGTGWTVGSQPFSDGQYTAFDQAESHGWATATSSLPAAAPLRR
jgi:hypothetical protein